MGAAPSQIKIEEQEKKGRKRQAVVNEIVQTEDTYVTCLNLIVALFQHPLLEAIEQHRPILTRDEVEAIFANVGAIRALHTDLARELNEHASGAENGQFAHAFVRVIPTFKIYTLFVNNFNNSLEHLSKLQKHKRPFQQFLINAITHEDCRGRDLPTLLITPIQRLPRYILLLQELQKLTPPKHKDFKNIRRALDEVRQMTDFINREKKVAENYQHLLQIQESFADDITLLSRERVLVEEGNLNFRKKSGKKGVFKSVHFFLFNDVLLLAQPRSAVGRASSALLVGSIAAWDLVNYGPLTEAVVSDSQEEEFCFSVGFGGKEYVVKMTSEKEKDESMTLFFLTISKAQRVRYVEIWDKIVREKEREEKAALKRERKEKEKEEKAKEKEMKEKEIMKEKESKAKAKKKGKVKEAPPSPVIPSSITNAFSSISSTVTGDEKRKTTLKKKK